MMPVDIDLSIKYSDAETKSLEKDLDRIKANAIEIQRVFDGINLKGLEAQFKGVETVAKRAFGRGLQSAISAVTRRIGGQREALKSLIRQYGILASVQKTGLVKSAGGTGKFEKWIQAQNFGWYAEKSPSKSNLSMDERRADLAKQMVSSEKTIAEYAKQYSVSQSTIRRDKKAIAQENAKRILQERKLLSSAATPFQIPASGSPPPFYRSLEKQDPFGQKEIEAGKKAMLKSRRYQERMIPLSSPEDYQQMGLRLAAQPLKQIEYKPPQNILPSQSVYQRMADLRTKKETPQETVQKMLQGSTRTPVLPKTADAYKTLGQFNEIETKAKATAETVKDQMNRMWAVPKGASEKITKPLNALKSDNSIDSIKKQIKGLDTEYSQLISKYSKAYAAKDTDKAAQYQKRMNDIIAERTGLENQAVAAQKRARQATRENVSESEKLTKSAQKRAGVVKETSEKTVNITEKMKSMETKMTEPMNLDAATKKEAQRGKTIEQNAQKVADAAVKENKARKSQAQSFEDYAKRYQHAQGRVDAAIIKGTRALSIMPSGTSQHQKLSNALGELRNISRDLGSTKNQAVGFKAYEKDADRLFNTISEGTKNSRKHMGFMNKGFAKFSIIMSGMAATMFVWQQLSAIISSFVRIGTDLEQTYLRVQNQLNLSTEAMKRLKDESFAAGKTGIVSAKNYAEWVAELQNAGYTGEAAIESVNEAIERERELLKGTVSGELKEFAGLMKTIAALTFNRADSGFVGFLDNVNKQISKIVNSKNDMETIFRILQTGMEIGESISNPFDSVAAIASGQKKTAKKNLAGQVGNIIGVKDAEDVTDLFVGMMNSLDWWTRKSYQVLNDGTNKLISKVSDFGEEAAEELKLDNALNSIKEFFGIANSEDLKPATKDMWEYSESVDAVADAYYRWKSIDEQKEAQKNFAKSLNQAFKITGEMPAAMLTTRLEEMKKTLQVLKESNNFTDNQLKAIEAGLRQTIETEEMSVRLPDYRKFYSTLRKYTEDYYDYELRRINEGHEARLRRGGLSETESRQIAQKEFITLEKRKAAPFMSSEKQLLETLGVTSGTKIEVGMAFDEKTGKVTATKMMSYLDLLNYNTEQTVKAINASLGKIDFGNIEFESKGGPEITKYIKQAAEKYGLDPYLLEEVAREESNFKQEARSKKGAIGVMQLMPDTAKELGVDPFNIEENIMGGAKYLKQLFDRFGDDLRLALAAYNAGPTKVEKYGNQVPPFKETQDYVSKITQRYDSRKPFETGIQAYGPRMQTLFEGKQGIDNINLSNRMVREGKFKNEQMLASFNQDIYKKAYDKLGLMTQEFYDNELKIINHFEEQNAGVLGPKMAKRIADKARFNLNWKQKTAEELKISEDGMKMLQDIYAQTDIYSPKLKRQGELKIEETQERLAKTPVPENLQRAQIKTMELEEFEKENKLRVNIDQKYFDTSKVMTDFLYEYKKAKLMKEVEIALEKTNGIIDAEQMLTDGLQKIDDERGKNRVDAWKSMYNSTGVYSAEFAEYEIQQLERVREETIRLTKDVAGAWAAYKKDKTKIEIEVALKTEDAMMGLEALRKQVELQTKTMAETVNENLKKIVDGTKENFSGVFFDTMQGEFSSVWDLFESTADRFKQMIDQMVSDYLASQLTKGLFGNMFDSSSGGGGLFDGLIGTILGGFNTGGDIAAATIPPGMTWSPRLATGGIIDKPQKFYKMASGGMINSRMSSGAVEIGEAGPEAVMPLKRTKGGKLGIETSAGITAPLKRLASGNLGIDSSLFDGGSMRKMAKGGIITKPTMFYGGDIKPFKRLATGDIIDKPIAPSLGQAWSDAAPVTSDTAISSAESQIDTSWHTNLTPESLTGTRLNSGGVAYSVSSKPINKDSMQHKWSPMGEFAPKEASDYLYKYAYKIPEDPRYMKKEEEPIAKMAKGGVISQNMISVEQQIIDKTQTFKPSSKTSFAAGGIISTPKIFRDGDYLSRTIHMASGGIVSQPFSTASGLEIGEKGPEVVMPLTKTSTGKLGVAAISGGGSKPQNITNTFNINIAAPKGKIDQNSMNQMQTKLGVAVQRAMRRNA